MPRIRTIKPEFWTDTKIVSLPFEARLLFIGLWNFCDDEGFLELEPLRLKMSIFPNDNLKIEKLITLLQQNNLITIFAHNDKKYIYIHNFLNHQKISHPAESKIKLIFQRIPESSRGFQSPLESSPLKGKERKGKERKGLICAFEKFYSAYPRKKSKDRAESTFIKIIQKQEINDQEELDKFTLELIEAINLQKTEYRLKTEAGKEMPPWRYPATWLNDGGWKDEVDLQSIKQTSNAAQRMKDYSQLLKKKAFVDYAGSKRGEITNESN